MLPVIDRLNIGIRFCVGSLVAVMLADVSLGIVYRYGVGSALAWTEELARYLMVWAGFLAASIALREGLHVHVDFLARRLRRGWRRALRFGATVGVVVFLVVTAVQGCELTRSVLDQRSPVLGISMAWPYAAIPTGAVLMLLELFALAMRKPEQATQDRVAAEPAAC